TIYSTDRWFNYPKFQETAEYLQHTMTDIGLKNVELLGAPADGVTQAGYWTMPLAWDARSARLEIVQPDLPSDSRVLADYQKTAANGSTPGATTAGHSPKAARRCCHFPSPPDRRPWCAGYWPNVAK